MKKFILFLILLFVSLSVFADYILPSTIVKTDKNHILKANWKRIYYTIKLTADSVYLDQSNNFHCSVLTLKELTSNTVVTLSNPTQSISINVPVNKKYNLYAKFVSSDGLKTVEVKKNSITASADKTWSMNPLEPESLNYQYSDSIQDQYNKRRLNVNDAGNTGKYSGYANFSKTIGLSNNTGFDVSFITDNYCYLTEEGSRKIYYKAEYSFTDGNGLTYNIKVKTKNFTVSLTKLPPPYVAVQGKRSTSVNVIGNRHGGDPVGEYFYTKGYYKTTVAKTELFFKCGRRGSFWENNNGASSNHFGTIGDYIIKNNLTVNKIYSYEQEDGFSNSYKAKSLTAPGESEIYAYQQKKGYVTSSEVGSQSYNDLLEDLPADDAWHPAYSEMSWNNFNYE